MKIDPRVVPWRKRQVEMTRLQVLRNARVIVCRCSRCGNDPVANILDDLIRSCEQLVAQFGDECCDRLPDHERPRALERAHSRP